MLTSRIFISLFSGIIGVAIGAAWSWFIAWRFALNKAKDNLRCRLLLFKDFSTMEAEVEGEPVFDKNEPAFHAFRSSYPQILSDILAYRSLLCSGYRDKIEEALEYYRTGNNRPTKQFSYLKSYVDIHNEMDFQNRINKLLKAIG